MSQQMSTKFHLNGLNSLLDPLFEKEEQNGRPRSLESAVLNLLFNIMLPHWSIRELSLREWQDNSAIISLIM